MFLGGTELNLTVLWMQLAICMPGTVGATTGGTDKELQSTECQSKLSVIIDSTIHVISSTNSAI